MKKLLLIAILVMATGAMTDTSAQRLAHKRNMDGDKHWTNLPLPHKSIRPPHWTKSCNVSYDAASTVLTVKFPSNGGSVTVSHNGTQVASMTAGSGTTFRSELRQYGTGNYTVIVSNGNTVVETKNFTVR